MTVHDPNDDQTESFIGLRSGTLVSHYTILEKIGAGGMGEVYLAQDESLNRKIALKFLSWRLAQSSEYRLRFKREAQAAARLSHPNIVHIYEVSEYRNRPFIAMEQLPGESLREILSRGALSTEKAIETAIQICAGIADAHRAGIVHRDIKPSNIIIDTNGRSYIMDFGIARAADDSHQTLPGAVIGTVGYMSPEQAQGQPIDHRSDIFSVGIVLYEMLTGNSPFKRANMAASAYAVVHDVPKGLDNFLEGEIDGLQLVVDKTLAKSPDARYQNADNVQKDLQMLANSGYSDVRLVDRDPDITPTVDSLAILCLRNPGPPEDDYISYGITEDLIVDLTRIGSIRVTPMRSVLKFKNSDWELVDIAGSLDVSLILDGSIHRTKGKVHVSAQLIDVASGKNRWAERWEESFERLHLIKSALAEGVSGALAVDTSIVKAAQVGEPETNNPRAYEYYLRGKYAFEHRHSTSDVQVASDLYDQALKLEPNLLAAKVGVAEILVLQGQYENATHVLWEALADARQRQQLADEEHALRLLARCFSTQSLWDEAARYAQKSIQVSKSLGDLAGEAGALRELIETQNHRAKYDEALQSADRVLQINRQLQDRDKEADALNQIGTVYLRKYECNNALLMYRKALSIATERDQASVKASSIANIGAAYFHLADFEKALSHYEESLQMFADLGESTKQAVTAQNMAAIYVARGAYHKALEMFDTALSICTKHKERDKCALTINNIAHVLVILGRYDEAVTKLQSALEMAADIGYKLIIAFAHANLGMAYYKQGELDTAAKELECAIQLAEQSSLRGVLATALSLAGEMYYVFDHRPECYSYFERALDLAQKVGDKQVSLMSTAYLATRMSPANHSPDRLRYQREIVKKAESFGNPTIILAAKRLLAESLVESGRSTSLRREGLSILHKLESYAHESEIVYESKWIRALLDQQSDKP